MCKIKYISLLFVIAVLAFSYPAWFSLKPIELTYTFTPLQESVDNVDFLKVRVYDKSHRASETQEVDIAKSVSLTFLIKTRFVDKLTFDFTQINENLLGKKFLIKDIELKGLWSSKINDFSSLSTLDATALTNNEGIEFSFTSPKGSALINLHDISGVQAYILIDYALFIIIATFASLIFYLLLSYASKFYIISAKQKINCVFLCAFFAFLFIPMLKIDKVEVSKEENRRLAPFPQLFIAQKVNIDFGREFDNWYNDRFWGRKEFIKVHNSIKNFLIGRVETKSAFLAADGWAFYKGNDSIRNFQNIDYFTENQLEKLAHTLEEIKKWCESRNIDFYFYIAPDKNKIYGEYYHWYKQINPDSQSRANQLIKYLQEHTAVELIYPYDALHAQKSTALLYWKADTHWNELGAFVGYQELMKKINEKHAIPVWTYSELIEGKNASQDLRLGDTEVIYSVPSLKPSYTVERFHNGEEYYQNKEGKEKALILGDSFSVGMMPYLATSFENLVKHSSAIPLNFSFIEKQAPQIFILESVERLLPKLLDLPTPTLEESE